MRPARMTRPLISALLLGSAALGTGALPADAVAAPAAPPASSAPSAAQQAADATEQAATTGPTRVETTFEPARGAAPQIRRVSVDPRTDRAAGELRAGSLVDGRARLDRHPLLWYRTDAGVRHAWARLTDREIGLLRYSGPGFSRTSYASADAVDVDARFATSSRAFGLAFPVEALRRLDPPATSRDDATGTTTFRFDLPQAEVGGNGYISVGSFDSPDPYRGSTTTATYVVDASSRVVSTTLETVYSSGGSQTATATVTYPDSTGAAAAPTPARYVLPAEPYARLSVSVQRRIALTRLRYSLALRAARGAADDGSGAGWTAGAWAAEARRIYRVRREEGLEPLELRAAGAAVTVRAQDTFLGEDLEVRTRVRDGRVRFSTPYRF